MTDATRAPQPGDIQPPPLAGIVRRNAVVTAVAVVVVMTVAVTLLVQGQDPSSRAILVGQAPTTAPSADPTPTTVIEATPSGSATPAASTSPATSVGASPVSKPTATASSSPTRKPDPATPPKTEQGGREVRNAPAQFAVFLTLGSTVISEGAVSVTLTVRNDSTSAQSFTTSCLGGQSQFGLFLDGTYQGGGSWGGCPASISTFTLEPGQTKIWTGDIDGLVGYRGRDEGRQRLAPGRYGAFGFLDVTSETGGWRTPGIIVEVR